MQAEKVPLLGSSQESLIRVSPGQVEANDKVCANGPTQKQFNEEMQAKFQELADQQAKHQEEVHRLMNQQKEMLEASVKKKVGALMSEVSALSERLAIAEKSSSRLQAQNKEMSIFVKRFLSKAETHAASELVEEKQKSSQASRRCAANLDLDTMEAPRISKQQPITVGVHRAEYEKLENGYDEEGGEEEYDEAYDEEEAQEEGEEEANGEGEEDDDVKSQVSLLGTQMEEAQKELQKEMKKQYSQGRAAAESTKRNAIEWAKMCILNPPDNWRASDLLGDIDFFIDDEWLDSNFLAGNMYRVWAFGGLVNPFGNDMAREYNPDADPDEAGEQKQIKFKTRLVTFIQVYGTIIVMLIQVLAPPLIIIGILLGWGAEDGKASDFKGCFDVGKFSFSNPIKEGKADTRFMGWLFLCGVLVNSIKVALDEVSNFKKVWGVWETLKLREIPGMREWAIFVGPCVNCWVNVTCVVAMFLIIGTSGNPKDIVFDALGIMFLFNLDDVGADMAFIDDSQWPGGRLYWIWDNMVREKQTYDDVLLDDTQMPMLNDDEETIPVKREMIRAIRRPEDPVVDDNDPCIGRNEPSIPAAIHFVYHLTIGVLLLISPILPVLYVMVPWESCEVDAPTTL